ncbi:MAG: alpha/beta hydrolase [Actinomycetota bacterium]|nr:alpha/beta hydrolase [Actinomycetota bacterium]
MNGPEQRTDERPAVAGAEPLVTIVAVHGDSASAARFDRVTPHLPDGVRLVPVTLPGFGGTPALGDGTVTDHAARLAERIGGLTGPVVVLGHGLGGTVAIEIGQRHGDACAGLVLHAPAIPDGRGRAELRAGSLPPLSRVVNAASNVPFAAVAARAVAFRDLPADVVERACEDLGRAEGSAALAASADAAWYDALEPSSVPTVILWGDRDHWRGPASATGLAHRIGAGRVRVVSGWGHLPMLRRPRDYAVEIAQLARWVATEAG